MGPPKLGELLENAELLSISLNFEIFREVLVRFLRSYLISQTYAMYFNFSTRGKISWFASNRQFPTLITVHVAWACCLSLLGYRVCD